MEAIENVFNGTARFGSRVTCQISRNGDLIHKVYLVATLPAAGEDKEWVDFVGLRLIKNVELEIGGQRIDKHYSDWMYIWNELSLPSGKREGYDAMVGGNLAAESEETKLYIPLEFWFCRNVGLALPLIALQYHEVKINIDFETLANCGKKNSVPSGVELKDASLWVDYIYLDTDERRRFAQLSHEYLIEQLQFTGDEVVNGTNSRLKLNFNHPTKELVWVTAVDTIAGESNLWNKYTTSADKNPMSKAIIQLNGQDRFAQRDSEYFTLVQPYQHHENIPQGKGINVYSFALKPEEHQPSGTLNFSRIDTAYLNMTMNSAITSSAPGKCKVFAVNYNVLRIMSGINEFRTSKLACAQQSAAKYGYCSTILDKQCKRNLVYNWLVAKILRSSCNKIKLSGTPFRALTTTPVWKHTTGTLGNDHGHSKNVKDWVIRSQAPAVLNALDRVKVQRIDGFGGERNAFLCDPLRYIPAPCESMGKESGAGSLILTRYFLTISVRKFIKSIKFIFTHTSCSMYNQSPLNLHSHLA